MPYGYDLAKVKRSGIKYFRDIILVSLEVAIILLIPPEVATFKNTYYIQLSWLLFISKLYSCFCWKPFSKIMNIVPDYYK